MWNTTPSRPEGEQFVDALDDRLPDRRTRRGRAVRAGSLVGERRRRIGDAALAEEVGEPASASAAVSPITRLASQLVRSESRALADVVEVTA